MVGDEAVDTEDIATETLEVQSHDVTVLNDTALGGLGSGSAIGPDHQLYVTNGNEGSLVRINPQTGSATVVGTGLPPQIIGVGGAMDVAFLGGRAYVVVTLAGFEFGSDAVMGVYRLENDGTFSVFADVGSFNAANPPADPDWVLPQGVTPSIQRFDNGLVLADGHLARLIFVDRDGNISVLHAYPTTDAVPTGLGVNSGGKLLVSEAGPVPHDPANQSISRLKNNGTLKLEGAWGDDYGGAATLIVDVEQDGHNRTHGLLQGEWPYEPLPQNEGRPAEPDTGEIVRVRGDGTFQTVVSGLDRPTSLEFKGSNAYVVTLTGTVLRIDGF